MMLKDTEYTLQSLIGKREVSLEDGKIVDPLEEVDRYVYSNEVNNIPKMMFYKGDTYKFVMLYTERQLEFIGRSSFAEVRLIPKNKESWKRVPETISKENFQYDDRRPVEYSYQQFQTPLTKVGTQSTAVLVPLEGQSCAVESLKSIVNLKDSDIYVLVNPKTGFEKTVQDEAIKFSLDNGITVVQMQKDVGKGRLVLHGLDQLFDFGYSEVLVVDPNMEIVSNFPKLVHQIRKSLSQDNVGIIQAWNYNISPDTDYADQLNVTYSEDMRAYSISAVVYRGIKAKLDNYKELFLSGPYETRPHRSVKKWLEPITSANLKTSSTGVIPGEYNIKSRMKVMANPSSQLEFVIMALADSKGWIRLAPSYSRAILLNDGSNRQDYLTLKYATMKLRTFPSDSRRRKFDVKA